MDILYGVLIGIPFILCFFFLTLITITIPYQWKGLSDWSFYWLERSVMLFVYGCYGTLLLLLINKL